MLNAPDPDTFGVKKTIRTKSNHTEVKKFQIVATTTTFQAGTLFGQFGHLIQMLLLPTVTNAAMFDCN